MDAVGDIKIEECTGCKMCKDVCNVNAISFQTNEEGFWYPSVDSNLCIKCRKCVSCCPVLSPETQVAMDEPRVFSAWIRDDDIRINSTSGGVFYALAKQIINRGGAVCGAVYCNNWKSAKHTIVRDVEGLADVIGTKYFQSDTEGIYREIREELKNNKPLAI